MKKQMTKKMTIDEAETSPKATVSIRLPIEIIEAAKEATRGLIDAQYTTTIREWLRIGYNARQ